MLFDELDIERQLAPDWAESKLYCSAKCADGSEPIMGRCPDGQAPPSEQSKLVASGSAAAMAAAMAGGTSAKGAAAALRALGAPSVAADEVPNSPEAKKKEREARWQDQCFLIEGWRAITDKFQECSDIEQVSNYEHIIPILAESSDVVSILANRANANLFFSLTPAQLSMLVPSIRLFIVNYKQEKTKGGPTVIKSDDEPAELYLDDHTEGDLVKSLMTGAKGRA